MFQFQYNEAMAKEGFSGSVDPIPTGTYLFEIKDTKLVLTKAGKAGSQEKKLSIKLVVADPSSPYDKRPVFLDLNILNNNAQAVEIAQKELNAICAVTKVYSFSQQDDENAAFELRGKFLRADVIHEDDGKFKTNRIKAVYDINGLKPGETVSGSSNMAPAPVVSAPAPAPVAPQQFHAPQPAPQIPQAPVAAPQQFVPPAPVAAPVQPQQFAAPQPAPMPQMPQAPQAAPAANPFQPPQPVAAPAPAPMPQAWQPPAA